MREKERRSESGRRTTDAATSSPSSSSPSTSSSSPSADSSTDFESNGTARRHGGGGSLKRKRYRSRNRENDYSTTSSSVSSESSSDTDVKRRKSKSNRGRERRSSHKRSARYKEKDRKREKRRRSKGIDEKHGRKEKHKRKEKRDRESSRKRKAAEVESVVDVKDDVSVQLLPKSNLQAMNEAQLQQKEIVRRNIEMAKARLASGELDRMKHEQMEMQRLYGMVDWRQKKKLRAEKSRLERTVAAGQKLASIEERENARMDAFRIALGLPTAEAQRQAEWRAEATRALAAETAHKDNVSPPVSRAPSRSRKVIGPRLPH